jgi:hypothetical protein
MYNYYQVRTDNDLTLTYKLATHPIAQRWAEKVSLLTVSSIRSDYQPIRGIFASSVESLLSELESLIVSLNTWMPEPITDTVDRSDLRNSLNRLHIHFPTLEATERDPVRQRELSRYNHLIHEIQYATKPNPYILICYDQLDNEPLTSADYELFSSSWSFGSLLLHYPQAGRHPLELMLSNDLHCPRDHIRPQSWFSSNHTMRFFDCTVDRARFSQFYHSSGYCWPHALDDPRLALGYIPLGHLERQGVSKVDIIVKLARSTRVVDFKVY